MLHQDETVVKRYLYQEEYEVDLPKMAKRGYIVADISVDRWRRGRRDPFLVNPKDNCIVTYRKLH